MIAFLLCVLYLLVSRKEGVLHIFAGIVARRLPLQFLDENESKCLDQLTRNVETRSAVEYSVKSAMTRAKITQFNLLKK